MNHLLTDDGVRIAWDVTGVTSGPPLLLSNSLGTRRSMWDANLAAFQQVFRVIRYDSRGHGDSDAPGGEYDMARLGADAVAVLDAAGVDRAHLVGVSMGGMVGQWLGLHASDRVDRLVLANTAAWMGPPESWNARIGTVRSLGMAGVADAVMERWFTPEFRDGGRSSVERRRAELLALDPAGYIGCCAAIRDMDNRPDLHRLARPVMVVGGTRDPATPPEKAEELAALIPGARLASLPAAHLSNIEQPPAFNNLVLDFLEA
ncbi:3-oxoadipate enol-lactonase [Brevundimonas sp. S30B]|uniref:3-oxoadipate enol-lactonase n=1 Tax=unclassified Brevundimonas TaxID=2622653 RepID=UPI001072A924|nr:MULTISPECIES: 3-oxoadipate enol-lactonase [unclassified Brevundimonas]QBX36657.1 3-oxoadipate enol-lactonase [Brevundimonas sp. MF30-B]TFW04548.1 3-oxoadipate enol-lactonase [Brevundimonas sp. S30B]